MVYTINGGQECELYHKYCSKCHASVYSCYTEYKVGEKVIRKYLRSNQIKYFGVTTETFFERSFLESVTEDLFTCHSRVTNIVDKYNRLNPGKIALNKKMKDSTLSFLSLEVRIIILTLTQYVNSCTQN